MKVLKKTLALLITICMVLPFAVACGGSDNCDHDNEVICNKCNEIVLGDSYYANMLKSTNTIINKGKGMKMEANGSFNMTLNESQSSFFYKDDYGNSQKLVAPNVEMNVSASMVLGLKQDGSIYGNGVANISAKMKNDSGTTLVEYLFNLEKLSIEDNVEHIKLTEKTLYPTLSASERERNEKIRTQEDNSYLPESGENFEMIFNKIIPSVLDSYTNTVSPYFNKIIDANKSDVNKVIATTLDGFCTTAKDGDNNVFTMTKLGTGIKKLPSLADKEISLIFDDILGEGSYEKLPETIDKLLNTKLENIIKTLEEKGIKIEELVAVADEVYKTIKYDENASINDLLGFNLVGAIDNLDKTKTLKQIIINYGVTEQELNAYVDQIKEFIEEYKDKSLYEILNTVLNIKIGQEHKNTIQEIANVIGNFVDEIINLKLVADKNGNIVSCECGFDIDMSSTASKALIDTLKDNIHFPSAGPNGGITEKEANFNNALATLSTVKGNATYKISFVNIA